MESADPQEVEARVTPVATAVRAGVKAVSGNYDQPPSREELDRLAADYVGRVGWDGQTPLDEPGRRLYAARDSGYMGPLDENCWPVTSGPEVEILRDLRQRNERSAKAAEIRRQARADLYAAQNADEDVAG